MTAAPTIDAALKDATAQLQDVAPETAALDARLLLQHVLQCDWHELILNKHETLSADEVTQWQSVLRERLQHKPVAKITGQAGFYGAQFHTTDATLDPRPDSETLIDIVQRLYEDHGNPLKILDLGTGTGCLLLTLLRLYPQARGVGSDVSEAALTVATGNAAILELERRAHFIPSDWFRAISGTFDLIVSNPPYIDHAALAALAPAVRDHDPVLALDGGSDGLDAYRVIVAQAHDYLASGGWLVVEIGFDQADSVHALFAQAGFANSHVYYDLSSHARVVTGQRIT